MAVPAEPADAFDTLAAGYLLAGLHRAVDLNLLGLVARFPKQPTTAARCLPGSLDAEETQARLAAADELLAHVLTRAKRRRG